MPRRHHCRAKIGDEFTLSHAKYSHNRQLAKLLSGNEVRGKVAIAAMQKAVNFTRSLSTWFRKVSLSTISSRFGDVLTLTIYLQVFCEFKTHIFSGKKADLFDRKRRCMARNGDAVDGVACLVLVRSSIAYLTLWASSFFFFFLIMLRKHCEFEKNGFLTELKYIWSCKFNRPFFA